MIILAVMVAAVQLGDLAFSNSHEKKLVRFTATIDATGRASNCIITQSSGSKKLDAETCRKVLKSRFPPPKGADQSASQGNLSAMTLEDRFREKP